MAQDREPLRFSSNTPGLIISDCDGVLVDSEVISIAVDEIVLADLGWRIGTEEIIARFVGRSRDHFLTVGGEPRFGGSPLQAAVVLGCGFTRYYDKDTAASWRQAFSQNG